MLEFEANVRLSKGYLKAAVENTKITANAPSPCVYKVVSRAIAAAPVDLTEHYRIHGSLRTLRVPGIGDNTKHVIELVLELGDETAREVIATMRRRQKEAQLAEYSKRPYDIQYHPPLDRDE